MASNETCPLYLRERGMYARKEKLDARSSSNSPWGLLCTKANDPLKITKWVIRYRTGRSGQPVDVRFSPKATEARLWSEMTRRARSRHYRCTELGSVPCLGISRTGGAPGSDFNSKLGDQSDHSLT